MKRLDSSISFSIFSMLCIFLIAVVTVFVGSNWSGLIRFDIYLKSKYLSDGKFNKHFKKKLSFTTTISQHYLFSDENISELERPKLTEPDYMKISAQYVVIWSLIMVFVLLLLYFFYQYMIYFLYGLYLITSAISIYVCFDGFFNYILPSNIANSSFTINGISSAFNKRLHMIKYKNLIIIALSIALPLYWLFTRHKIYSWIIQDILAFLFCVYMLRTIRLPSFRICFYLLSILFFYDIFFVFITPLFNNGISI